jgi:hypothetical protein
MSRTVPPDSAGASSSAGTTRSGGGSTEHKFPARLHFLLSELERDGLSDVAGKVQLAAASHCERDYV